MKKFSFLKLLTDAEIVKILQMNNLRLKSDVPSPLSRGFDDDGEYRVIAKCEHIEQEENSKDISFMSGALLRNLGYAGLFLGAGNKYSAYNGDELIEITDFYMSELMSLKSDKEEQEYVNKMSEKYQEFMVEKFGDMYIEKAEEFFKKMQKHEEKENKENLEK